MPIDNNKPPDPLIQEFCELTGMSPTNLSHTVVGVSACRDKEGKPRRHRHGIKIKVSTPGSASAGAGVVLRNLRSSKLAGKSRKCINTSPSDVRGGKRNIVLLVSDEISKVLCNLESGAINPNLKFAIGSSSSNYPTVKPNGFDDKASVNDGSFIKVPLDKNPVDSNQKVPIAKSSGLETGLDHTSVGDVGNTSCGQASSRDGIAMAKTGSSVDIAGLGQSSEHTNMEGVVNMSAGPASDLNGIASDKGGSEFEFGNTDKTKGILKKPIGPFFKVQFGVNSLNNPFVKKNVSSKGNAWNASDNKGFGSSMLSNQFTADVDRFAEKLKQCSEELALKMEYTPNAVSKMDNGNRRIQFTAEEVFKGGQSCSLQLYGYFIGTSMDYRVVRGNLMKMWRVYGIEDITKTSSGIFYFKSKSEEGMKTVLDFGPWMVQNVSLVLNIWEPGIWLEKTEPSSIPIWREMLKKAGKLDFARVLVEVNANEDLPNILEIEYPPLGNRPARVGKLDVKYQWKPPLCTHCKTFGHSTLACKIRPRSVEEVAVRNGNLDNNADLGSRSNDKGKAQVDDGFVTVGKNNKPVLASSAKKEGMQNRNSQGRSGLGSFYRNVAHKQSNSVSDLGKGGNVKIGIGGNQGRSQFKPKSSSGGTKMANRGDESLGKNLGSKDKPGGFSSKNQSKPGHKSQSLQELSRDPNFKPKVLMRGSSSKNASSTAFNGSIPISNPYQVLEDVDMEQGNLEKSIIDKEEFFKSVWPSLKEEVDILFEAGIYPSKSVRLDWDIHQLEYFYKNCHKFKLDPSFEDDDVDSEKDGIATDMKPEFDSSAAVLRFLFGMVSMSERFLKVVYGLQNERGEEIYPEE
ncbi:hypothetical protein CTI12_AA196540 [Artemisia annua]|uniref:DUF4283 domain-containing protein n=1 Tax=Artemisia annua TaxID=35608 RepID=A0A2U1P3U2_ARTAN|nr:hypothetical protein CTI12_AA196540 [Artemisia annua]